MTREEILAMTPGCELDALVAEKVMGFMCFMDDHQHDREAYPTGFDYFKAFHEGPSCSWHFSTRIAAAWEVVEKMGEGDAIQRIAFRHEVGNDVFDITPEHICKASLLALLETEEVT